jgi:hypothetical protein
MAYDKLHTTVAKRRRSSVTFLQRHGKLFRIEDSERQSTNIFFLALPQKTKEQEAEKGVHP